MLGVGCKDETSKNVSKPLVEAEVAPVASHVEPPTAPIAPIVDSGAEADADVAAMIDHALTLLEDAGKIVHANIDDCDAMGERLEAYRQEHLDVVAQVETLYQQEHESERKAIQPRFRARFKAAWANVRPGVMKCRRTPKVNRVIHEIWGDDPDASE